MRWAGADGAAASAGDRVGAAVHGGGGPSENGLVVPLGLRGAAAVARARREIGAGAPPPDKRFAAHVGDEEHAARGARLAGGEASGELLDLAVGGPVDSRVMWMSHPARGVGRGGMQRDARRGVRDDDERTPQCPRPAPLGGDLGAGEGEGDGSGSGSGAGVEAGRRGLPSTRRLDAGRWGEMEEDRGRWGGSGV